MHAALVRASEATAEGSQVSPYLIGALAFGVLAALLVVTLMLKVEPKRSRD
jgi:hypothetical protein